MTIKIVRIETRRHFATKINETLQIGTAYNMLCFIRTRLSKQLLLQWLYLQYISKLT